MSKWAMTAVRADAGKIPLCDYGSTLAIQSAARLLDAAYERGRAEGARERTELLVSLGAMVKAVADLADNSGGVYGLHLNGDVSPWGELLTGGRFEGWLGVDLDAASAILKRMDGAA